MPSVFIHGLGQTPDSWTETLAHLASAEARCPNLPALLQCRECTYKTLYRAFAAFCEEQETPLNLCGLSLGAVLALHYAIEHPRGVHSLVLIGGQYRMPRRLLRLQGAVFRLMPASAFCGMGFSKEDFLRLTASMSELDFSGRLGAVVCPVLVACGERDRANRRAAEEMAEQFPKGKLQIIPGAGHEVNVDAPEKLAKALTEFYGL